MTLCRYSLQLTSVVDVSQPFYGQLLQVQKKDNSNTMVSAETQFTQKVIIVQCVLIQQFCIKELFV